jgi:OOP family OmpA-OmpF porin
MSNFVAQYLNKTTLMNQAFLMVGLMLISSVSWAQHALIGQEAVFNTYADEQQPVLSPDGSRVYFTRGHYDLNVGKKPDKGDIYVSVYGDSGTWATPQAVQGTLNNKYYNGVIGFINSQQLLLYGSYESSSMPAGAKGVSWTKESTPITSYTKPEPVAIQYYKDRSELNGYALSQDGRILVMSMESYKTIGAEDLYVSFWNPQGKQWSEPLHLGSVINTPNQELTPTLSQDNKHIYFSSNGHPGYGSRDIFVASRLDDSWTNWSTPKNLGSDINTEGAEMYFSYYANHELAVYTSTLNSNGYGDLRFHDLSVADMEEVLEAELVLVAEAVQEPNTNPEIPAEDMISMAPINGIGVLLNVLAADTGNPLLANVQVASEVDTVAYQENFNGISEAVILVASPALYSISLSAEGYMSTDTVLQIQDGSSLRDLSITLLPIEVGKTVQLNNVLFKRGTTDLLASSYNELDLVAEMMAVNSGMEIKLSGHTDNQGNGRLNQKLSQERVDAVIAYFENKGIASGRLSGKGYGGSRPIASNANEDTRKLNRRVEFVITKE